VLVVHLPKLLGAIWALRNVRQRQQHGGIARVVAGVLIESLLSTLIAPLLMLSQTSAVASILVGRDAGWGAQRRVGEENSLAQLLHQYRWPAMWGLAGAAICWSISPAVFAWMSPIIIGLLLAAPIGRFTARRAGRVLATLLGTLEERCPPQLLIARAALSEAWQERTGARPAGARAPARMGNG
jgi:membrane glycosyltransferase